MAASNSDASTGAGRNSSGSERAVSAPKAKAMPENVRMIGNGRRRRPAIDLDEHIEAARDAAKAAKKALCKARTDQRNERRKQARLLKKAGQLSPQDLERIAVLKRTGFWDPNAEDPTDTGGAGSSGGSEQPQADRSPRPDNAHDSDDEADRKSDGRQERDDDEERQEAGEAPMASAAAAE